MIFANLFPRAHRFNSTCRAIVGMVAERRSDFSGGIVSLQSRARRYLRARGGWATFGQTFRFVWRKVFDRDDAITARRRMLGIKIYNQVGGVVQAGPLKGFRLGTDSTWGAADKGPMLLGFYETAVTAKLAEFSAEATVLVDIGAADGYFGVGAVASGLYERSVCFELDPVTREAMADVARLNQVEDRVVMLAAADATMFSHLADADVDLAKTVVLCDIEGGEFTLFDDALLAKLSACRIIIELHERMTGDGDARLARLTASAERHFVISFLVGGPRDPGAVPLLQSLPEDDRWLLCSEGRSIYQQWMVLVPRNRVT
jgi:hypothetical protein